MALVETDAARIIEEKILSKETMAELFDSLVADKVALERIGQNARNMALVNAKEHIAEIVVALAEENA